MTLKAQERSQTTANVIAPCAARADLRAFNQAELLKATMIVLNRPRVTSPPDSFEIAHLNFISSPPFNVAVCGNDLEYTNQAITFEPDHAATLSNLDRADGAQALAVRVDFAVRFQTSQPKPIKRANQLQVFQPCIPTVEHYASGLKITKQSTGHLTYHLSLITYHCSYEHSSP